jgi:hypothetical protein
MNGVHCGKQIALKQIEVFRHLNCRTEARPEVIMVRQWNWLRLLTYCLSRVLAISLVIAVVLVGGALAFAHGQTVKTPRRNNIRQNGLTYQPISGVITDSDCGARHAKDANMSAAECARFCTRNGARYVLVDGEKRYTLTGNTEELSRLAGQRVTISGSRNGDTVVVNSLRTSE